MKGFFWHILHINISVLKLKSLSIFGDCFLMDSHYRNVGYGSNENVTTGSAEAVREESSSTQTHVSLQLSHPLLGDESRSPAKRARGEGRVNECLTRCQSAGLWQPYMLPTVLFTGHNHFKSECYVQAVTLGSLQVTTNDKRKPQNCENMWRLRKWTDLLKRVVD